MAILHPRGACVCHVRTWGGGNDGGSNWRYVFGVPTEEKSLRLVISKIVSKKKTLKNNTLNACHLTRSLVPSCGYAMTSIRADLSFLEIGQGATYANWRLCCVC